jgi:DNA topoisomerase-1
MALALPVDRDRKSALDLELDEPDEAARAAGLRYVSDSRPGIRRRRSGKGFKYLQHDGEPVRQLERLRRIKALAIPPAWTDVWICGDPRGHIQATGRDARGRKQYRYHARWREARDETKYDRMIEFGRALPRLRRRVGRDLGLPGLPQEKVVATVVRLLDSSNIRVGNPEYARDNQSYGLTTLREKHVTVRGDRINFRFRGKAGKEHDVNIHDRRLANIVRRCQDLPGQELFRYVADGGEPRTVESADVNDYLREATGQTFTAKDFRTWSGTVLAAAELARLGLAGSETEAKQRLVEAVRSVAGRLGNTLAVCRRCYVHPAIVDGYLAGRVVEVCRGERDCEKAVLELLVRQAKAA